MVCAYLFYLWTCGCKLICFRLIGEDTNRIVFILSCVSAVMDIENVIIPGWADRCVTIILMSWDCSLVTHYYLLVSLMDQVFNLQHELWSLRISIIQLHKCICSIWDLYLVLIYVNFAPTSIQSIWKLLRYGIHRVWSFM